MASLTHVCNSDNTYEVNDWILKNELVEIVDLPGTYIVTDTYLIFTSEF